MASTTTAETAQLNAFGTARIHDYALCRDDFDSEMVTEYLRQFPKLMAAAFMRTGIEILELTILAGQPPPGPCGNVARPESHGAGVKWYRAVPGRLACHQRMGRIA